MSRKYVYSDGSLVPANYCVMPDRYVTTIAVTLRTMSPVSESVLRAAIQNKYEVIGMVTSEEVCVVRNTKRT
jgi:hypothetical protein